MRAFPLLGSLLLVACDGGSGVAVPSPFAGAWGTDCADPYVSFVGDNVHIGPDKADYSLKSATARGSSLVIRYDIKGSLATETYMLDGGDLRLDRGIYGGQEATWHKAAMHKCS